MTTVEPRELPEYFAVLRPTSGGGPSYQLCQRTIHREVNPNDGLEQTYQRIDNADIYPEGEILRIDVELPNPHPVYSSSLRNAIQTNSDIRKVKWWFLPHSLQFDNRTIPVIDSNKRYYLTRSFRRIRPFNISQGEYETTVAVYGSIMDSLGELLGSWSNIYMLRHAVEQEAPLRPPSQEPQHLPLFVADLLVKDAKEKNLTCPITMSPLSELSTLGITSCYHIFDYMAIQRWLLENSSCPFCRSRASFVHRYHLKN